MKVRYFDRLGLLRNYFRQESLWSKVSLYSDTSNLISVYCTAKICQNRTLL